MSASPAVTQEDEQKLATFNRLALQNNSQVLSRFRIFCALFVGGLSGILGIEGIPGFAYYFLQHVAMTVIFCGKCGLQPGKYFINGWRDLGLRQLAASETFMTYLLMWTVFFNLCYIF